MVKKVMRIGTGPDGAVYVTAEIEGERLSITGVVGPRANGDCRGSCGQCVDALAEVTEFAPGWDAAKAARLAEIWERWHLNDMRAGSPAQRDWLAANPVTAVYPESHYEKAKAALAAAGLQPDASHLRNGQPYSYGSAWLFEPVPPEIVAELATLPDAEIPLPGRWFY